MLRFARHSAASLFRQPTLRRSYATMEEVYASSASSAVGDGTESKHRTSVQFSIDLHRSGSLLEVLEIVKKNGVNMTHISTRSVSEDASTKYITCYVDMDGRKEDANICSALEELTKKLIFVNVVGSWTTPWYPKCMQDLDKINQRVLAAGADLQDDPENPHPGFHDQEYRARRKLICEQAFSYRHGMELPNVAYSQQETEAWGVIWDRLTKMYPTHACKEYNHILPLLVENAGYARNNIPQIRDVSAYLESQTGFTLRPIAGLMSSRDFLAGLAFRVFHSTQYIRHHSKPLYTPEPDVVHELMGHAPMFADPKFAEFSQIIGLASLGASDEDIKRLATCYWFTVEFGLVKEFGGVRAFGAGVLSSFGELEHAVGHKAKEVDFDPFVAANTPYPITTFQPLYYVARDLKTMTEQMKEFAASMDRPFTIQYNPYKRTILTYSRNKEM